MGFASYERKDLNMKKYILWLLFAAVAVGTALYKPVKDALNEQPVDKNISLAIYRATPMNLLFITVLRPGCILAL